MLAYPRVNINPGSKKSNCCVNKKLTLVVHRILKLKMKPYKRSIFLTYLHSKLLVNSSIGSFLADATPLC